MITVPKFLGTIGKVKWKELRKRLHDLKPSEADSLALLCCSWEDYLEARAIVTAQGRYIKSDVNGRIFAHPAIKDRDAAWVQIVKLSKAFGLHPDQREIEEEAPDKKWEGILEGEAE